MWNPFNLLIKLLLHYKQDDPEQKRPSSDSCIAVFSKKRFRLLAINLKNVGLAFFKITKMQSVSTLSICVHSCFSFLLLYFSYVVKQLLQCFILFFGHFGCQEITSFCMK